ncbi:hypothetical protein HDU85_005958 [Gaertneriomyces sp. JEL0708]|nr:hypothetical protein HDU85_005958 [Gaertneriomyces sp. JEL0708]
MADGEYEHPDPFRKGLRDAVLFSTASISMLLCFGVLIIYLGMRISNPIMANRVSLRIAVAISFVDIFFELANILSQVTDASRQALCSTSMYLIIAFGLLSSFLTACIAFNLLLVFAFKRPATYTYELIYFTVSAVLAFGVPIIGLATDRIGWTGTECWFKVREDEAWNTLYFWEWGIFYGWILLCVVFCVCALVTVRIKLSHEAKHLETTMNASYSTSQLSRMGQKTAAEKLKGLVHKAISRIAWYTIVPLLAWAPNIAADASGFLKDGNIGWQWLVGANFGLGLLGSMNAIIFLFDPNVSRWFDAMRYRFVKRHYFACTAEYIKPTPSLQSLQFVEQPSPIKYFIARRILYRHRDHVRRMREVERANKHAAQDPRGARPSETANVGMKRPTYPPQNYTSNDDDYYFDQTQSQIGSGLTPQVPPHLISTASTRSGSDSNEAVAREIEML